MEIKGELCNIKYDYSNNKYLFFDNLNNNIDNMFEYYLACIILGIIGDKIGFGNGDTEFYADNYITNKLNSNITNDVITLSFFMIYSFIAEGGITGFNFQNKNYSDDTILLLANLKSLITNYKNFEDYIKNTSLIYLDFFKDEKIMIDKYKAGIKTIESLRKIKTGINWKNFQYDFKAGGSGGSMRAAVFGLAFHTPSNLSKLIESSIETCLITHNNGIAFLGSFTVALFVSYAIQKIPINKWCFELVSLLSTDDNPVDSYILLNYEKNYNYYLKDKQIFLDKFNRYLEDSFNDYEYSQLRTDRQIDPGRRSIYYHENFGIKNNFNPGAGSDDSVIIAYDSLILCEGNFEKLIYIAMLHLGDSDTTGMIAGNLYGAYYGFKNVYINYIFNENIVDNYILNLLNNKNIIDSIYLLFEKYYNKNIK